jgi:hypothetical protein
MVLKDRTSDLPFSIEIRVKQAGRITDAIMPLISVWKLYNYSPKLNRKMVSSTNGHHAHGRLAYKTQKGRWATSALKCLCYEHRLQELRSANNGDSTTDTKLSLLRPATTIISTLHSSYTIIVRCEEDSPLSDEYILSAL